MNKKSAGFTLLEVMVALFIVAIALGGVIKVMGNSAHNISRLSNKTFAQWVALNEMAELRVKRSWPKFGEEKGSQEMAGQNWSWVQKTIKTDDKKIKRIEFSVWAENEQDTDPLITIAGFLGKP